MSLWPCFSHLSSLILKRRAERIKNQAWTHYDQNKCFNTNNFLSFMGSWRIMLTDILELFFFFFWWTLGQLFFSFFQFLMELRTIFFVFFQFLTDLRTIYFFYQFLMDLRTIFLFFQFLMDPRTIVSKPF